MRPRLLLAREEREREPGGAPSGRHALLCGPPRSGKTSLLFQYAYGCCAADPSARVVFICKRSTLERGPPCLPKGADIRSEPYTRFFLRYLNTDSDIRKFCAGLAFLGFLPRLIVIDDFFEFFTESFQTDRFGPSTRSRDLHMVQTLALAHDAANFASELLAPHAECELLVSDTTVGDSPRSMYIYSRWLPQIFIINAIDESTFSLKTLHGGDSRKEDEVRYSIVQKTLQFENEIMRS